MDRNEQYYLTQLLPPQEEWVTELERQAEIERIPIMDPLGIHFLMQLINMNKPNTILEIGTAIGYSALRMLEANPLAQIVTIERDEKRYHQALENIQSQSKQKQIHVIYGDALEKSQEIINRGLFDLMFIDAAKGQYQRFFELYCQCIPSGGVIVSDNVLFKGYVADSEKIHSRNSKIGQKIRNYNEWLINHPDFTTTIVPIGDGVAISIKK
ncbi:O-methyltransferase [Virgibacillus oceani]|uniref:tRNA 5-hydroxyuridine methyltransferase n=1 Tax=Virgibacillus oceani TaxID=1479511 RepID=A0A917GZH7_9BACI|nr:O-methyltransferase [Virgibacillus oceani]GGG62868.1 SAM-dependent methyltransferase [Virgibacillus oceani]